jgi:uracil-DNA glycosylase family 4
VGADETGRAGAGDVEELRALVGQLRTHLDARGRSGLQGVMMAKTSRAVAAPIQVGPPAAVAPSRAVNTAPAGAPEPVNVRVEADAAAEVVAEKPRTGEAGLRVVRDELGDCQRCKLAPSRNNLVFGVGNPDADLVFVGEAPGADEDAQGEPFVGKAGQLLTKMIEAMGYTRADVYICNVLKCRPPGNRNPEPDEVASCEPFLKRQLAAIRPRMIVALGKFAAQCLLRDDTPITRLRGGFRSYEGIPLMPTLHPAYLLRDPSKKKLAWEDLKAVNAALARVGVHPPKPPAA